MGLKCLLGHDFGEREVERDRREAGDEVVVVYRTVENCRRCGTRRTVSENKEVRSIRGATPENGATDAETTDPATPTPDADAVARDDDADRGRPDPDAERPDAPTGSLIEAAEAVGARDAGHADSNDGDDDAIILGGRDDADAGAGGTDGPEAGDDGDPTPAAVDDGPAADPETAADPGSDASDATAGSGAELIDAGGAESNGSDGAGAWPTPDPDAEDEGFDAAPHEDTDAGVDFGGGLAPTDDAHAAYVGTDDADADDGFVVTEHREASTDGPTEFRCPNCGATRTARNSSLRAGDVCPDCRKGYVAERAIEE